MMNKFKNGLGHSLVLAGMCLAMLLFMSHKSVAQEVGEVGYMITPDAQTTFRYVITAAANGEGNGGKVAVRKYNDAVSGAIVIPSSVTITVNEANITYAVTAVRADGFKNCASLTSVTFPSSVTSIGQNAFNNCSALAGVSLVGSGVTSIGQNAFGSCSALTSVTFNDALSTIGRRAFRGSGLTSVTIPSSVTSIGNGAFSNCGSLTSVTIQDGITSIGDSVFELSNLASVTFPSSVTSIGAYAFASCPLTSQGTLDLSNVTSLGEGAFLAGYYGMTSVTFSSSLTTIPQNAFRGRGLTSVTIPSSVTSIGNGAFYGCYNMTDVTFNRTESAPTIGTDAFDYQQKDVTTFHVPSGTLAAYKTALHWTTGGDSYYGATYDILYFIQEGTGVQRRTVNGISYYAEDAINRRLTVYDINTAIANIPETLTGFGEGDELTQEYTVTKINLNRTNYRRRLEQLTVPATVTSINSTFENAFHLYYLKFLGATPPTLCTSIFASCRSLDTIVAPAANLSAYSIAFSGYLYGGVAGNIVLSTVDNVPNMYIPMWGRDGIMYRITSANTMSVYRAFDKIYDGYSDWNSYMNSYNIPNTIYKAGTNYSVTSIEKNAFRNLYNLRTLNIAAPVSSIGDLAFYNCNQLQTLNISYPAVINSIGNNAFENCVSLRGNISFTSSSLSIGELAFRNAGGVNFNITLGTVVNMEQAFNASGVRNVTINGGVISDNAFYDCTDLQSVTIGSGVTTIGGYAFKSCYSVTTLNIPNNVTSLGEYAFRYCSGLNNVTIGTGVTTIPANCFENAATIYGSSTITINGATTIAEEAFRASGFSTVVLPSTLTTIGTDAFKNATSLNYITFNGTTPPTLANNVLDNTSGLEYIYVPCLNMETYKTATSWANYIEASKLAKIKPIRSGEAIASTLTSDLNLTGEDCDCKAIPSTLTISNNASLSFEDYTNFVAAMKDVTINVEKELNVDEWNLISALNGTRVGETYAFLDNNLGQTSGMAHAMAAVPYDFAADNWGNYVSRTDNTPIASQSFMVYPVNVALTTDGNAGTVSEDLNESKITLTQTISGNEVNEKNNVYIPLTSTNSEKWYPLANPYLGRLNLNKFHEANESNLQDNYAWIFKDGDWEGVDISGATNYAIYPASGFLVSLPEISSETTLNMHVNQIVTDESVTMKSTEGNNKITLSATNNGVEKEIYAHIDEVSDNGYGRLDAKVMFSSNEDAVNPYFNVEGRNIFDNYFSQLPAEYELNFNSYKNNQIDFALKEEISEIEVTLIDIANNNAETVLSVNEPVQIDLTEGQNEGRYRLRFAPKNSNINDVVSSENSINIWNRLSEINISGKDLKRVEIFNTLGQKVYHAQLSGDSATFNSNLSDGAYIVKVYTQSSIKSKKVIIR
ncbi:MAG: leucine-rich repeat domain-containing protein [Synergistales bacterium]|nr:leucine-rich repeat domain-containing protein [Bacteroidales bacterium]MDY6394507.1 leucine-rich repeat domain-containing protein [Bacteroidales bacterium]MDY6402791.1 leucine-rich repeat domain-containing protein [Bacteroidales bacterium]MDY6423651.1 leucine-rich repeat domain-containing protein [Bacteroidales bacterium]MDY6435833.1 leucine-rich repeat domain-containing protein [Synergistales bacterium]